MQTTALPLGYAAISGSQAASFKTIYEEILAYHPVKVKGKRRGVYPKFSINVTVLDSAVLLFFERRREDKSAASLEQYFLSLFLALLHTPLNLSNPFELQLLRKNILKFWGNCSKRP
ncbi:MAG: hypothetical protein V1933_04140 [Candidatus Omnitrophota bacterium]